MASSSCNHTSSVATAAVITNGIVSYWIHRVNSKRHCNDSSRNKQRRQLVSTNSQFEQQIGYSRAVACGNWVFVSGTTGYDYSTMTMPTKVEDQCRNAFNTIQTALEQVGSSLDQVVRVRYIVHNKQDWPKCWPILRQLLGKVSPAATMIVANLQEEEMKIEIEVTAAMRYLYESVRVRK